MFTTKITFDELSVFSHFPFLFIISFHSQLLWISMDDSLVAVLSEAHFSTWTSSEDLI